jgi:hypothetical protein
LSHSESSLDLAFPGLAELFLHHRVLVVPIATGGKVHALVTRHDFFCALVERFGEIAEDDSP